MKDQPSINDWSEYLIWAEKNLKDLEDKLLHKQYDMESLRFHAACIKDSVDKSVAWVEQQLAQQTQRP
jgi:hypothetical protein